MGLKGADVYFSVWDGAGQVQSITASKYGTRADGSVALIAQETFFSPPRRISAYTLLTFASVCASSVTELHKLLLKLHGEFRTNILRLFLRQIFPHGEKPDGMFLNGLDSSRTSICPVKKCLKSEAKLWVGDGVGLMSDTRAGLFAAASSAAGINSLRLLECCVYTRGQLGMKSPSS